MLSWAITFLVVAIIAGVLGLSGVAGTATNIAYILFCHLPNRRCHRPRHGPTTASHLTIAFTRGE